MTDERKSEIRARLEKAKSNLPVATAHLAWREFEANAPQDIADLLAEVDRLRAYIRNAPELADTCVFDALCEVCEACRCPRNPAFNKANL